MKGVLDLFVVTSLCFWLIRLLAFMTLQSQVVKVAAKETNSVMAWTVLQSAENGDMNRIGSACSKEDIVIIQDQTSPLPQGIPAFTVEILNVCVSDCSISNIHINCGWFSSSRLVNPSVFRRVQYGDCLVNDGEALYSGQSLSFQYSNSFSYPLSVSSVTCS